MKVAAQRPVLNRYKSYTLRNYREIPELEGLPEDYLFELEVVARVFPFKTNRYVTGELIDWDKAPEDPMFLLNFPRREMLEPEHFETLANLLRRGSAEQREISRAAEEIRWKLNPYASARIEKNIPLHGGEPFEGVQHKYKETVLFFPSQGQTCHAYCTFCFRWPQFTPMAGLRFSSRNIERLVDYLSVHPEVTDVLFTGGDPMVMRAAEFAHYVDRLLAADLPHLKTIRIGTKALSYWPYRFTSDEDSAELLAVFRRVYESGRHLALMPHLNHPRELGTEAVREAIWQIRKTGAVIRTQSPILKGINDDPGIWTELWNEQVKLSCVPYYMFMVRDTGARHCFSVPLVRAWEIYREAAEKVSGMARTARGPSMSADPGKVRVLGVTEVRGEKVIALDMLQGRNPDWVHRPFFAKYDPGAGWLDDLRPAFGEERFFFEQD